MTPRSERYYGKKYKRPTLQNARAIYVNRFTMEHVPDYAARPFDGKYYAPQFRSDREWYDNTRFPGETGHISGGTDCYTRGQTWPLGHWLDAPYREADVDAPAAPKVPLGFTHAEVESRVRVDTVSDLQEYLNEYGVKCDDFLIGEHIAEVVTETLTDGSIKSSVRIRPVD